MVYWKLLVQELSSLLPYRFIDVRSDKLAHEYRVSSTPAALLGYVTGIATGPTWITVAYSPGFISTLDIRTGFHLASWHCKGIEGELSQVGFLYSNNYRNLVIIEDSSCLSLAADLSKI